MPSMALVLVRDACSMLSAESDSVYGKDYHCADLHRISSTHLLCKIVPTSVRPSSVPSISKASL